jgi:hypothetical protein
VSASEKWKFSGGDSRKARRGDCTSDFNLTLDTFDQPRQDRIQRLRGWVAVPLLSLHLHQIAYMRDADAKA